MTALASLQRAIPMGGTGTDMPTTPVSGSWPAYTAEYTYTLKADLPGTATTKMLRIYLESPDTNPNAKTDESMDIRVREDCVIVLKIDDKLQARFSRQYGYPLKIGAFTGQNLGISDPTQRYVAKWSDISDKQLKFYATRSTVVDGDDNPLPNLDSLTICVVLDQLKADGKTSSPGALELFIDPGIKNPGDDTIPFLDTIV